MPVSPHDKFVSKIILILAVAMFVTGIILVLVGYYLSDKDMMLKAKSISGSVSTLVVVGVIQMVLPIPHSSLSAPRLRNEFLENRRLK